MIDALQNWLATKTSLPCIWLNANAPRPDRPYLGLQIIGIQAVGTDDVASYVDNNGQQTVIGQRTASVSVHCYEQASNLDPRSAITRMAGLRDLLRLPQERLRLHEDGLAVFGDANVRDVPQLESSQYQPQAMLDMELGFEVHTQEDINWIETVMGQAGFDNFTVPFTAEI